jgi:outer membrane protein assembly factor BamB
VGVPRFTLTAQDNKLFARFGSPITALKDENGRNKQPGSIVGLDLATQRKLFQIEPDEDDWAFEGPPLSDGSRLFVAMRRSENTSARSDAHVACFDLQTGELRWRRWVCGSNTPGKGQWDEISHSLLSLQDGVLYFNTNLGAVAALSAQDGAVKWVTRYPRASFRSHDLDHSDVHFFRDLNPCLLHGSLAICAPADCDRIFALDTGTGQMVWETGKQRCADAVHLLGVGAGNVIASGDYLYWIDAATGALAGQFPQPRSGAPGFARADPPGFGRGLLAGQNVYWPTREKIFVFKQQTHRTEQGWTPIPVRQIELTHRGVTGGNLLMSKGILLIATSDRLYALKE